MKNKAKVAEQLAKVFVNLGQGIILAGVVAGIIQHQTTIIETLVVIAVGIYTIGHGLYLVSEYT